MGGLRESGRLPPAQLKRWGPGGGGAVSGNPDQVLHLTKETPSLAPSAGGRAPRSREAWITAGSQAPFQDWGEGPEGYLLLQTLSGLSEAINSLAPLPRALANPWGRWETTRAARTPLASFG